jgi:hypothetical protein
MLSSYKRWENTLRVMSRPEVRGLIGTALCTVPVVVIMDRYGVLIGLAAAVVLGSLLGLAFRLYDRR